MRIQIRQNGERMRRARYTSASLNFIRPHELMNLSTYHDPRPLFEFVQTAPDTVELEIDTVDPIAHAYFFDHINVPVMVSVTLPRFRYELKMACHSICADPTRSTVAKFLSIGEFTVKRRRK